MPSIVITEHLHQRLLLTSHRGYWPNYGQQISAFYVLEFSPSGSFVRLQNEYGNKFWKPVTDVAVVEVLKNIERNPGRDASYEEKHAKIVSEYQKTHDLLAQLDERVDRRVVAVVQAAKELCDAYGRGEDAGGAPFANLQLALKECPQASELPTATPSYHARYSVNERTFQKQKEGFLNEHNTTRQLVKHLVEEYREGRGGDVIEELVKLYNVGS